MGLALVLANDQRSWLCVVLQYYVRIESIGRHAKQTAFGAATWKYIYKP